MFFLHCTKLSELFNYKNSGACFFLKGYFEHLKCVCLNINISAVVKKTFWMIEFSSDGEEEPTTSLNSAPFKPFRCRFML